ncbi:hypothetical protein B0H14DRAFT_2741331, partial [Mycena olivaceomarginata]
MSTGAKLPVELERLVFESAAQNRPMIPTLVLVAHRVRVWLEPLLYNVLLFDAVPNITGILDSIRTKPAPFLASAVRHVLMYSSPESLDMETLVKFLESCPGITTLSLIGVITGPRLLPALRNMHIRRLSVDVRQLFRPLTMKCTTGNDSTELEVDLDHPLFGAVTHLDLFNEVDFEDEEARTTCVATAGPVKAFCIDASGIQHSAKSAVFCRDFLPVTRSSTFSSLRSTLKKRISRLDIWRSSRSLILVWSWRPTQTITLTGSVAREGETISGFDRRNLFPGSNAGRLKRGNYFLPAKTKTS